jgi:hypothetical protein
LQGLTSEAVAAGGVSRSSGVPIGAMGREGQLLHHNSNVIVLNDESVVCKAIDDIHTEETGAVMKWCSVYQTKLGRVERKGHSE